jgi:hypothetical protein
MATPLSLVFDLLGRDVSASKAFNDVGNAAEDAGRKGEGFGSSISNGFKVAGAAFVASGIVEGFKSFYDAAAESAKIGALTQAAITSTGGAARISADQVSDLATAISNKTGVDDEAIQSGANLLLTFTNVRNEAGKGNDIFNQTTSIMTDMAAVLGTDASGSAIQLGKALNDPIKGVTALQKVGVSFTDSQKDQIKTLVATGDTLGAQKVILAELSKEFGGAAEAASTPIDKLKVNLGNLQEQVGGYLIPVFNNASTFITSTLIPAFQTGTQYIIDHFAPAFQKIKDGVQGVYDLIIGGDFTGKLAAAFNIQEDNPVVGFVLDARDSLLHAWDNLGNLWAGLDVSGLAEKVQAAAIAAGGSLLAGIKTGLDTGNWAPLGESIVGIFKAALSRIGDLAGSLYDSLSKLMGKVDWVGVGSEIGKQVPTLLAGLAIGILNFDIGGLLKGLGEHWFDALMALIALALAPAKVVGKLGEVLAKIPIAGKFLEWGLNGLKGLTDNIVGWVGDIVGGFVRGFAGEGTAIGRAFGGIFETIKTSLYTWGDDVLKWFRGLPARFVEVAEYLGQQLREKFNLAASYMGDAIRGAVDNIVNVFRPITDRLSSIAQTAWDWVVGKFNGMKDAVVGIFSGIRDLVGTVWDGLVDKVKSPIRVVFNFVNGSMIGPINGLLSHFPGGVQLPLLPGFAAGGYTGDGGKLEPKGVVHGGEYVFTKEETAKAGVANLAMLAKSLRGYDVGGFVGSIGSAIGGAVTGAVDFGKDILSKGAHAVAAMVLDPLRDAAKALVPSGNVIGDVLRGTVDKLVDAVLGKSSEADSAQSSDGFGGGGSFGPAGAGVERWRPVVLQALAMLGQSPSLADGVLSLIKSESGGNPNAINLTDSNARAGHPSRGLMQTIPSTFEANRSMGLPDNIVDPLANIYAGIHYALQRYGPGMLAAGGRHSAGKYIGYETGVSYVPQTGLALLHEGEAVLNRSQNAARLNGASDGPSSTFLQLDGDAVTALLRGEMVQVLSSMTRTARSRGV